ncbi:MAG: LytTR family transcriptional regulator DNA-binding domain-containing protein [Lachnospiraceae bacterium]|nr:LytTR family transcriptional regulator DNA-binding domain-containing protein [Lachnospiraceae bacterium]
MQNMVDIEFITDENCIDPKVTITASKRSQQVENIISAIENVSENDFPLICANGDDGVEFLSQRDIIRAYIRKRRVFIETDNGVYTVKKSLQSLAEDLNDSRFVRISQSEIINIYKVKRFDIDIAGTIGVEFENGTKSWASRSCVKAVKEMLRS